MARTFTLATLRTRAKDRADMKNSTFVTDAEWGRYISASYTELYDKLVKADPDRFYKEQSLSGDGTTKDFAAASDYYGTIGVDYQASATDGVWFALTRIAGDERNFYPQASSGIPQVYQFIYNTAAPTTPMIRISPVPENGAVMRHCYIVAPADLSSDGDIVDGISGWEEYIIVCAAIKALAKEESSTVPLERELARLDARIDEMIENRSAGSAGRIVSRNCDRLLDPADWDLTRTW